MGRKLTLNGPLDDLMDKEGTSESSGLWLRGSVL